MSYTEVLEAANKNAQKADKDAAELLRAKLAKVEKEKAEALRIVKELTAKKGQKTAGKLDEGGAQKK